MTGRTSLTKTATLSGVAHNIAHHACSGLSYLSPHLAQALRAAGLTTTTVDVLSEEGWSPGFKTSEPLDVAIIGLKSFIGDLLNKHGFSREDITGITLSVTPAPWDASGYILNARAVITARNARTFDSGWLSSAG